jgi:hypothetical protein
MEGLEQAPETQQRQTQAAVAVVDVMLLVATVVLV